MNVLQCGLCQNLIELGQVQGRTEDKDPICEECYEKYTEREVWTEEKEAWEL